MSSGPAHARSRSLLKALYSKSPLRPAALGGVAVLALVALATFATCGGCGQRAPGGGDTTAAHAPDDLDGSPAEKAAPPAVARDSLIWKGAAEGEEEDLAALAAHEGAAGLVEATSDPALRDTALRAMAHARGWAQMPYLASVASGKDEERARLALESMVALAARPRTAEDPEDAEELREGCEGLLALARDAARARRRRVLAVRALRMLPCSGAEGDAVPTDVDAK